MGKRETKLEVERYYGPDEDRCIQALETLLGLERKRKGEIPMAMRKEEIESQVYVKPGMDNSLLISQGQKGPEFIPVTMVPIEKLRGQPEYQRDLNIQRVKKISELFDPRLFGIIVVARYPDGRLSVGPADGRHRVEAVAHRFWEYGIFIPCHVVDVKNEDEESWLYEQLNKQRKQITARQLFKARDFRGEPVSVLLRKTLQRAGWNIEVGSRLIRWNVVGTPVAVEYILSKSPSDLVEVLEFINRTWAGQNSCRNERVLLGVHYFINYYQKQRAWDELKITQTLSHISLKTILRNKSGVSPTGTRTKRGRMMGDYLAVVYNDNKPKGAFKFNIPIHADQLQEEEE